MVDGVRKEKERLTAACRGMPFIDEEPSDNLPVTLTAWNRRTTSWSWMFDSAFVVFKCLSCLSSGFSKMQRIYVEKTKRENQSFRF